MSLHEQQARFRRLLFEHAAWRLLHAENAPIILAFINDLFAQDSEVPFGKARVALEAELPIWQEVYGLHDNAGTYLRQWIQAGWLRELDDKLTRTDAFELALRFAQSLDQRDSNTTASHLRIVQDTVRDLAVALSPNPEERITLLTARRQELDLEIERLQMGEVPELSAPEQRERIRGLYQLTSVLTGDFRRLEDEIRQLDQRMRIRMIESESGRGEVVKALIEHEGELLQTDAGQAFDGFYQLLCDQNRITEFREQIRSILARPASQYLKSDELRYLSHLVRELGKESERVFQVRRRTEESLRAFVESGVQQERRAVERLLRQLERLAVNFKDQEVSLREPVVVDLPTGSLRVRSPSSIHLRLPEERLDTRQVAANTNSHVASLGMLDHLNTVKVLEVAQDVKQLLTEHGPMTVASIVSHRPITGGLEELVAHVRIAKAVSAVVLEHPESLVVVDRTGNWIRANIPSLLMSAEQFPTDLEELAL
ncbi:DUF3375 domain-containing protein [Pseudomonas aeruginosa]|uniref:DUF3375 domain-containing protein n=1 Tax=Pseudomonas TaxID=286 RepID=UPI00053DC6F9|nr:MULTISPECIES: DUF3375 domain-containing protein [Pseudomonas]KSI04363.1 hypothetical protein AO984_27805 [Pseudomonas aeruginosa]KSK78063.1 hypothetical protein APA36_04120 [Pseudomonas aeruginosa]KSQ27147.1 hypothetical protein APB30_28125 [Pseudomonas aeruginosa]MBG6284351.1 DUF3375 domain-containing protein [Pseudomonas aeruginosa]MBH3728048.1 DUF3375 domain-containing protein [Pseudomonas aeruginosa]